MRPRIEYEAGGIFLVVPLTNSAPDLRIELSPDGLTALAGDIAHHFERVKSDPEQMKKIGASFVNGLVDLFTKGK